MEYIFWLPFKEQFGAASILRLVYSATIIWTHICSDVVKLGDEGMFDNVHGNLRGDYHTNVRKQHP